jgi:hypothetical protein
MFTHMKSLAVALLVSSVAHAAAPSRFQFKVPAGWADCSEGAPPADAARVPAVLIEEARKNHFAFCAADVDHADDGFMENVNAIVEPGTAKIDMAFMSQLRDSIAEEAKKAGSNHHVVDISLAKAGGITVGRYVSELGAPPNTVKQIGYIIPGNDQHAILTYSTTPAQFAHYAPIFDQAAQATVGVAEPPLFHWQSIVATVVALGLVIGYSIMAKRKNAA